MKATSLIPSDRPDVLVFEQDEVRRAVPLDKALIDAVEDSFRDLGATGVIMPPIMQFLFDEVDGQTCAKGAACPRLPYFAVKLSSIFRRPSAARASEANGLSILLDRANGRVACVLLDHGYLTEVRTAAASAVSIRYIAPKEVEAVAVIGSGKQAVLQAEAAFQERPWQELRLWARRPDAAADAAAEIGRRTGAKARPAGTREEACEGAQVIITTTTSSSPVLLADHVSPGTHVVAMGSDAPGKNELDPKLLQKADLYAPDSLEQCRRYGELAALSEIGGEALLSRIVSLPDIVLGREQGRTSDDAITIADHTGVGIQDTAAGNLAFTALTKTNEN
ncbi:MAG: ornithine cyclodeaminase family protein [Pseudomonadota bacterium]